MAAEFGECPALAADFTHLAQAVEKSGVAARTGMGQGVNDRAFHRYSFLVVMGWWLFIKKLDLYGMV
ncbi:hypothetical protein [Defluviimonas salinarum]|uniref:hypothetical protein n=1 Tax=Defluviimonas salinarum TaxID=2992147 RepID=UPI002230FAD8|nr:hypothetical protein [Defluviimonas salinarum]